MRNLSLKRSGMAHINEGSQFYLLPTHLLPYFTPQPQSVTALWPVLIFHPVEGRRPSWPQWLVTITK